MLYVGHRNANGLNDLGRDQWAIRPRTSPRTPSPTIGTRSFVATSCQPRPAARVVRSTVPSISRQRGEVDAADEGDRVIDDHELLVMAVHAPLAGIQHTLDPAAGRQLRAYRANHLAGGLKRGHRGARPHQHPHLNALGQTSEDVTHSGSVTVTGQFKTGGEMPPGDVDP